MSNKAEKRVFVKVPRAGSGEDPYQLVGVNGEMFRIKRGERVEVPESVAEVLQNADAAADVLDSFNEANEYRG